MRVVTFENLRPVYGIPYCRDHLRRKVKAGEFPAPLQLSERRIAWRVDDIDAWIEGRPVQLVTGGAKHV